MKSKLLIVDDSATILKIVTMAFEKEDVEVLGATSGKEALAKMPDFQPDIVVADTTMPGMSGFDLSKKIKDSVEFKSVLVLLLTSDFEGFDEKLFADSRADDHIAKPFNSESIVSKVNGLLEHGTAEEPAAIELSMEDAVDAPAPIKLSADDMVETSESPEADDVAMASSTEESFDDMVGDIIQENVSPEELPDDGAESEPGAGADDEEMSMEEMLASAEEMFLAEVDESESDDEVVVEAEEEPADDSADESAASPAVEEEEDAVMELESIDALELEEEKEEEPSATVEAEEPASAPPELVLEEEEEPAPTIEVADAAVEEEEAVVEEVAVSEPAGDTSDANMSIEELLSSAEELLKDNYLEKAATSAPEEEVMDSPPDVPQMQEQASGSVEVSPDEEAVTAMAQATSTELNESDENLADVDSSALDSGDDLDSVFDAIQSFEAELEDSPLADIAEEGTPSAVGAPGIAGKPDLIRETLSYLSDLSPGRAESGTPRAPQSSADGQRGVSMDKEMVNDMFSGIVGEHIQEILEQSLKDAIATEISGLSQTIERSVRESVKEVTPGIARAIIQEEIERIRKMEEA